MTRTVYFRPPLCLTSCSNLHIRTFFHHLIILSRIRCIYTIYCLQKQMGLIILETVH